MLYYWSRQVIGAKPAPGSWDNTMIKRFKFLVLVTIVLLTLSFSLPGHIAAQGNISKWLRYNTTLNLQENSGITIEEVHEVALPSGTTEFWRVIPTDKLEGINNIQVQVTQSAAGGYRTVTQADTGAEYTFQVIPEGDAHSIIIHIPPNNAPSTTFVIRYFVVGAVRIYETGDRLDWQPYGTSAIAPIDSSTITYNLPPGFNRDQLTQESRGVPTEKFIPQDNRVEFKANNVPAGGELEVSLLFPHGVIQGNVPAWQQEADTFDFWTPVLQWGGVLLGLLFLVIAPLAVYGWWYFRLRVTPDTTREIPRYAKSPPGRLSPAAAGVLVDGKSQPRHIMATLLDLAAHGALHVYPDEAFEMDFDEPEDKDAPQPSYYLYGVDMSLAGRPYEETLYAKIFGYQGARKRLLADMYQTLYMAVPEMKSQIDFEVTKFGFFSEGRDAIRRQYLAFGVAAIIFLIILSVIALALFYRFTPLVLCPFSGLIIGAIAFIVSGFFAPRHTKKGATAYARWQAFYRYLKDMDSKQAAKDKVRFSRLLPYAVAFGIEKEFVQKFVAAGVVVPKWWSIPVQKGPDTKHEDAHAWVSQQSAPPGKTPAQRQPKARTASVIRRLGDEGQEVAGRKLKDIQDEFMAFIAAGLEVFGKAPALAEEDAVDFEIIGGSN
jgi:hypothetical protein